MTHLQQTKLQKPPEINPNALQYTLTQNPALTKPPWQKNIANLLVNLQSEALRLLTPGGTGTAILGINVGSQTFTTVQVQRIVWHFVSLFLAAQFSNILQVEPWKTMDT